MTAAESHNVRFFFNDQPMTGRRGETVAAALLANNQRLVGRSFKFHRPRGILCYAEDEPNALLEVKRGGIREPNLRATMVPVSEGLRVYSQNHFPSLRWDVGELLSLFSRFMSASFYYKTFKWPNWNTWEPWVRKVAGLGRAPNSAGRWHYRDATLFCHTVVVGAGASGLAAIRSISQKHPNESILLIEKSSVPDRVRMSEDHVCTLDNSPNVRVLQNTMVVSRYDEHQLLAVESHTENQTEILWNIHCSKLVLANGALERPLAFPDNDRPGIMLASALTQYCIKDRVSLQGDIVCYGNNDSLWRNALELQRAGVTVLSILDVRNTVDADLRNAADRAGISIHTGVRIIGTRGWPALREVRFRSSTASAAEQKLRCRWLAVSGGWTPSVQLYSQQGAALAYSAELGSVIPDPNSQSETLSVVGRAAGNFDSPLSTQPQWSTSDAPARRQWVDYQYDVTVADIQLAYQEAFKSVEHVKRFTTNGMSLDQGKTSNMNGLGVLADAAGQTVASVGTTRYRPPYHPVSFGLVAGHDTGELYSPRRLLPAQRVHENLGAQCEDYGDWWRPAFYPRAGETEAEAIARETAAVRSTVGVLDYSSLGKIQVSGPDAREFLNRMVMNNLASLQPGHARYCLMLHEDGTLMDDGIAVCTAQDAFLLHTTSAGSGAVYSHLDDWLQCEWPSLDVVLTDVTGDWGTLMLAGPKALALLQSIAPALPSELGSLPHMHWFEGTWQESPLRVLRASFTGEPGYEVSVPCHMTTALYQRLLDLDDGLGLVPFGVESLMQLRLEKGFIHLGADTDGTTMPQDLGWAPVVQKKSSDFVGRRSVMQQLEADLPRFEFTGLEPLGGVQTLAGAHVLEEDGSPAGFVTSAGFSVALNKALALGLVTRASQREGEVITVFDNGNRYKARICAPCFFDPEGRRIHG